MTDKAVWTALGTMSGTSLDGVDVAILRSDGEHIRQLGPWRTTPYTPHERKTLQKATDRAREAGQKLTDDPAIRAATEVINDSHIRAISGLMAKTGLGANELDVIGFHGQTLLHRPDEGWTWQIGEGEALAEALKVDVVDDFRRADMEAGGQGAPLAPIYHAALLRSHLSDLQMRLPVAVLNLGGVANVTWVGGEGEPIHAFDTGPGIGLIDDWVRRHSDLLWDEGGKMAAAGRVDKARMEGVISQDWFSRKSPKSLDRNDFSLDPLKGLNPEDGAATLTALTAYSVSRSVEHLPSPPRQWLLAGGGRLNPALVAALREALKTPVISVDEIGWRGDALEAETFAFLAIRSRLGLPLNLPTTTGAKAPVPGGQYWPAKS